MQSIESVNGLPFVVTRWVTAFGDLVVRRSWLVLLFGTKRVCFGNGCVGGIRSRTSFGMLKVSMLGIADPVRGGVSELVSVACLQEAQDADSLVSVRTSPSGFSGPSCVWKTTSKIESWMAPFGALFQRRKSCRFEVPCLQQIANLARCALLIQSHTE